MSNALAADLRRLLTGTVTTDEAELASHETDYGQITRRRPGVVVRPNDAADVAATLRYASTHGVPVSPRGTGHSLRGQSTNEGGILLNLNGLANLTVDRDEFRCGPGTRWRTVVAETTTYNRTPPALTGYPHVTVGGTHSAGGWGEESFRYGAQVDNCTGLSVVTGTGERLWCDRDHEPELFGHVLGGMGQLAVITEVAHRLRSFRPISRTYPLSYNSPADLLTDLRLMAAGGSPLHSLECMGEPGPNGWRYRVLATIEADAPPAKCPVPGLVGREGPPSDQATAQFLARPRAREIPPVPGVSQPWVVVFLPWSKVAEYLAMLNRLPGALVGSVECPVRLWPARRAVTATPMFRVPNSEDEIMMVSFFSSVRAAGLPAALALLSRVSDIALELGGTRHLGTWVHMDLPRWRLHFGTEWQKVNELKHRYDPAGILNPGFIEYEPLGVAQAGQRSTG